MIKVSPMRADGEIGENFDVYRSLKFSIGKILNFMFLFKNNNFVVELPLYQTKNKTCGRKFSISKT